MKYYIFYYFFYFKKYFIFIYVLKGYIFFFEKVNNDILIFLVKEKVKMFALKVHKYKWKINCGRFRTSCERNLILIYSLCSIIVESFYHFGMFHNSGVIFFFSKNQHISSNLLYSLFNSLHFSYFTLFFFYLTHLT